LERNRRYLNEVWLSWDKLRRGDVHDFGDRLSSVYRFVCQRDLRRIPSPNLRPVCGVHARVDVRLHPFAESNILSNVGEIRHKLHRLFLNGDIRADGRRQVPSPSICLPDGGYSEGASTIHVAQVRYVSARSRSRCSRDAPCCQARRLGGLCHACSRIFACLRRCVGGVRVSCP